ncbi:MAG: HAMP domain-containing histidine kinase [Chitinophagaceae bacterium]|nr:HAMP domain-containing histidine kinase [Chitinophagaceae bacterium]MCU0404172.1 HAMP domain-containing histidine kinase [Chitinophagaceae bacterium]
MKKIFPIIFILISISLVGIIYLQYTNLKNLMMVKEEQMLEKMGNGVFAVANSLAQPNNSRIGLSSLRKRNPLALINEVPAMIKDRYTQFEIAEKLSEAFREYKVPPTHFEFAVATSDFVGNLEMQTPKFVEAANDTINNRRFIAPVYQESGSWSEGLFPTEYLIVIVPEYKKLVFRQSYLQLGSAIVFTLFIMFVFFLTVGTMVNQRKLSEIKGDFINNMTHEFKTPLATISLAVDALNNEKVLKDPEKLNYFRGIIKDENKRMNKHVETILQAAALDKQEINLNKKELYVHKIIENALGNFELVLKEKQGMVNLRLNAKNDRILADEQHFTNMVSNLIDNAIKYSKEVPEITITTHNIPRGICIKVEDRGIGMTRESVKRIFEKFFRAHTGNIHNVKGFGLGMSYVKTIIDAHKGKIKVDSTLGKGTSFTVEMPVTK